MINSRWNLFWNVISIAIHIISHRRIAMNGTIKDELSKPLTMMNDPHPLFIECVRKLPTADHVHHRIVDQIIKEDLPQVR